MFQVEAEEITDVSEAYKIESVPTFLIINKGQVSDTIIGANPPELTKKILELVNSKQNQEIDPQTSFNDRLIKLVNSSKVIVFIKGTVDEPRCGFTAKILTILKNTKVPFQTFDILSDNSVREGLKKLFNWPTFPQLYVNGNLVGGLDIVKELEEEDSLISTLEG